MYLSGEGDEEEEVMDVSRLIEARFFYPGPPNRSGVPVFYLVVSGSVE